MITQFLYDNIAINKNGIKLLKFIAICEKETSIFNVMLKYIGSEDVTNIEKIGS